MPQVVGAPDEAEEKGRRKPLKFPTAFTVLGAVLLVVWVLSFVLPFFGIALTISLVFVVLGAAIG